MKEVAADWRPDPEWLVLEAGESESPGDLELVCLKLSAIPRII